MNKFAALAILAALCFTPAHAEVAIVSGGIGEGGRASIEALQGDYSFKAVFSGRGGDYLSEVEVRIFDKGKHEVVATTTDGPILLADLPRGRYTIEARVGAIAKRVSFIIGKKGLKTLSVSLPLRAAPEAYAPPQSQPDYSQRRDEERDTEQESAPPSSGWNNDRGAWNNDRARWNDEPPEAPMERPARPDYNNPY